jgi:adenine/guanine phosphoribosyltransferase-like PRPP-binding protein
LEELLLIPVGYVGYKGFRKGREVVNVKFRGGHQMDLFDSNRYRPVVQRTEKTLNQTKDGVLSAHRFMMRTTDKVMTAVSNGIILGSIRARSEIPVVTEYVKETAVKVRCLVHPHLVEFAPDDSRTELVTIEIE